MEFQFKQIHGPLVGIVVSKTDRGMATRETMEPAAFLLQQERLNNKTRQLPVTIENGVISIDTGNCLNHSQRLGPLSSSDPFQVLSLARPCLAGRSREAPTQEGTVSASYRLGHAPILLPPTLHILPGSSICTVQKNLKGSSICPTLSKG